MATLLILRGLPASGKSTFARTYAGEHEHTVIVSLDGLRRMTAGSLTAYHARYDRKTEQLIVRTAHAMICDALRNGLDVVMDAQNAGEDRVHELVRLAADCDADVLVKAFPTPLDTLLERNRNRAEDDRVPEDYLRSQYERFADNIATPMRWVRIPVEPAGRRMWQPSAHGDTVALVDAEAVERMARTPLSVETFRMVEAFLPSKHGRNNTNMLRVPRSEDPRMPASSGTRLRGRLRYHGRYWSVCFDAPMFFYHSVPSGFSRAGRCSFGGLSAIMVGATRRNSPVFAML